MHVKKILCLLNTPDHVIYTRNMAAKKPEVTDVVVPKSAADVQRLKLEKLMKNPVRKWVVLIRIH